MGNEISSKTYIYWLSQIGGWFGFSTFRFLLLTYYLDPSNSSLEVARHIVSALVGIFLSHAFRYSIKHYKLTSVPIKKLIPIVLILNLALGFIYIFINYFFEWSLYQLFSEAFDYELELTYVLIASSSAACLFLVWSLIYFVVFYFKNYKKEEIERLKWEGSIKDFELNKLKSQLNPHFVFNALNSIRFLVDDDPKKAKSSITQLSNILRNSLLADRSKTVDLKDEMKTVMDYLILEKQRFEERLNYGTSIDERIASLQVPPMMIQTIVENAVKHGISKIPNGGKIEIKAYPSENNAIIEIRNDGEINHEAPISGFGILNTRQRLELIYNSPDAFSLIQENENTVLASVKIPLKYAIL